MGVWIISNLLVTLNNVAVEILEHTTWCLGLRISVENKPTRGNARSKDMHMFHFTKDSPKQMGKYTHFTMQESSLCFTFLATLGIISLLIFISLIGMNYLITLTLIFLVTSKVYYLVCYWPVKFLL